MIKTWLLANSSWWIQAAGVVWVVGSVMVAVGLLAIIYHRTLPSADD